MKNKSLEAYLVDLGEKVGQLPFMVGSAAVPYNAQLVLVGGGATCFSMGTFWDAGVYTIDFSNAVSEVVPNRRVHNEPVTVRYQDSPKLIQTSSDSGQPGPRSSASITAIPRIKLQSRSDFDKLVQNREPVIIESLDLGGCVEKWNAEYLVQSVGESKKVGQVGVFKPGGIH